MRPLITSILDNDMYAFTQHQAIIHTFPTAYVEYPLIIRDKNCKFPKGFGEELNRQIFLLDSLKLSTKEESYLRALNLFLPTYIEYLKAFRYNSNNVYVIQHEDNTLEVYIRGYWTRTKLYEVPILAIISELYFIMTGQIVDINSGMENLKVEEKRELFIQNKVNHIDFGTRRRYSWENQNRVIRILKNSEYFKGTSNVFFAMIHGVKPLGTQAHEWIMAHGALYGYKVANEMAMKNWVNVWQGKLGIALTDTYTLDNFLLSFNELYARIYDGTRQDSGDPYIYTDKMLKHYDYIKVKSQYKSITYSNALDHIEAININSYMPNEINKDFGIGTKFTCDLTGIKPMNIVIKLSKIKVNPSQSMIHCIKLSDDMGKVTGNIDEINNCKYQLNIK